MRDGRSRVDGRDRGLQSRLRRAGPIAVAFAAAGLIAAGCSGSPASHHGSAKPSETTLLIEFSACLRAHGLPHFPDPQSEAAGGGYPSGSLDRYINPSATSDFSLNDYTPQFQAAEKHCSSLARASLFIMTPAQIQAQTEQQIKRVLVLVACMRKHGVPGMPDPNAQGVVQIPSSIDMNSPQYKAAAKLCHGPTPPQGGPPPPGG
jgi:hypothetical protein